MDFEKIGETTKAIGLFCLLGGTLTGIWQATLFGGCAILFWRILNEYAYEDNWWVALRNTRSLTAVVVMGVVVLAFCFINRPF